MSEFAQSAYALLAAVLVVGPIWLFVGLFKDALFDLLGKKTFAAIALTLAVIAGTMALYV